MAPVDVTSNFSVGGIEQSTVIAERVLQVTATILSVDDFVVLCKRCDKERVPEFLNYRARSTEAVRDVVVHVIQVFDSVRLQVASVDRTMELTNPSPGSSVSQEVPESVPSEIEAGSMATSVSSVGSWKPSRRVKDGLCYAKIINHLNYKTVINTLGTWPTLNKILALPADYFEPFAVLKRFTIRPSVNDMFHVSTGGQGSPLLNEFTSAARSGAFDAGSYGRYLVENGNLLDDFKPMVTGRSRLGGGGESIGESFGSVRSRDPHIVNAFVRAYARIYADSGLFRQVYEDVPDGFCYQYIVVRDKCCTVSGFLGPWPSVRQLLLLPSDHFKSNDVLDGYTITANAGGSYHIEYDGPGLSLLCCFALIANTIENVPGTFGHRVSQYEFPVGFSIPVGLGTKVGGSDPLSVPVMPGWDDGIKNRLSLLQDKIIKCSESTHVVFPALKFMNDELQTTFRTYGRGSEVLQDFSHQDIVSLLDNFISLVDSIGRNVNIKFRYDTYNKVCESMLKIHNKTKKFLYSSKI